MRIEFNEKGVFIKAEFLRFVQDDNWKILIDSLKFKRWSSIIIIHNVNKIIHNAYKTVYSIILLHIVYNLNVGMRSHPDRTTGRNGRHSESKQLPRGIGVGYLLFSLTSTIKTVNVANATANINASNTLIGFTPFTGGLAAHPALSAVHRYYNITTAIFVITWSI